MFESLLETCGKWKNFYKKLCYKGMKGKLLEKQIKIDIFLAAHNLILYEFACFDEIIWFYII